MVSRVSGNVGMMVRLLYEQLKTSNLLGKLGSDVIKLVEMSRCVKEDGSLGICLMELHCMCIISIVSGNGGIPDVCEQGQ